eukprot:3646985-Prymnesium_polylepis.1
MLSHIHSRSGVMIYCPDVSIETHRIRTSHSPSALSGLPGYGAGDRSRALPAGAGTLVSRVGRS